MTDLDRFDPGVLAVACGEPDTIQETVEVIGLLTTAYRALYAHARKQEARLKKADALADAVERVIDGLHSYSAQFLTGTVADFMYEQADELQAALDRESGPKEER